MNKIPNMANNNHIINKKELIILANLTQLELQNLRHLIGKHETAYQKFSTYAQASTDPQVKEYFERSAQSAQNTKQKLITFLN